MNFNQVKKRGICYTRLLPKISRKPNRVYVPHKVRVRGVSWDHKRLRFRPAPGCDWSDEETESVVDGVTAGGDSKLVDGGEGTEAAHTEGREAKTNITGIPGEGRHGSGVGPGGCELSLGMSKFL